jgi:soluble lytic murein transglycosylase-like protein
MLFRRLLATALVLCFAGSLPSAPAVAADLQVASKVLAPPKGRLAARKRLVHPSLPMPAVARGGGQRHDPGAFRWFWTEVSTARTDARAGRWGDVLAVVEGARADGKPVYGSRAAAEQILAHYGAHLAREAARHNVSLALLVAVIAVESGGNPQARSPKGAGGLMQLMPGTAERFGVSDAYAPSENIRGGARYLDWLLRTFREDAVLALAGYNAGEGAVDLHAGVPPYGETRDYVAKVAGAWAAARTLCATPPRTARDACEPK